MKTTVVAFAVCSLTACGVVGTPIPPEDVGVVPVIERQKRSDAEAADRDAAAAPPAVAEPQGQDVDLPPLRPVGSRGVSGPN
ncbi:MAG TPA: hypothetical protein VLC51_00790 [Nitrospira sp.]|nr:hypothetical protein [Nitrospira sp.]